MTAAVASFAGPPPFDPSPFHYGEQQVQTRVGTREGSERIGRAFIRPYLTDQATDFYQELPMLFVSNRAADGTVWATTLSGQPGFIAAQGDTHLRFDLKQMYGDPVRFAPGDRLGGVGIMLHNRRRNRLNLLVETVDSGSMLCKVLESFGNCPKYIQVRHIEVHDDQLALLGKEPRTVTRGTTVLGPEERAFIARSDTLLLGTGFSGVREGDDGVNGCDCNDRGGMPGFVQVSGDGTLEWGDYTGNNMFMSFGNLLADPRAGIQFIDFGTGDSLQLTGRAQILWDKRVLPGAQRTVEFATSAWVHIKRGLPISTKGRVQMSPYNPLPPTADGKSASLQGIKLMARWQDSPDIATFQFHAPVQPGGGAFCEAGQFASFDFPGNVTNGETLNRTWTISSPPQEIAATGKFTISVKKAGLVSSWLHEHLSEGSEVVFRGVDGEFTLDKAAKCIPPAGVLLIAGGIGITPMRVMFAECLRRRIPVTLLYSVRRPEDAAFLPEFTKAAAEHQNVKVVVAVTGSGPFSLAIADALSGRISAMIIKQVCPDVVEREVFQCGPDLMMKAVTSDLESIGMPLTKVHQESFNF